MQDTLGAGINDAILALHARTDIRICVWTGEGRMYCAGGDPKAWQAQAAAADGGEYTGDGTVGVRVPMKPPSPEVSMHLNEVGQKALQSGAFPDGVVNIGRIQAAKQWHTWALLPQFSICLANGSAMGGGVGCVACCDYVISVKKAYFVLSEVKIGVIPATISPYVIAKIGISNSKKLFCCAENLTAEGAKAIGLVQEVVDTMNIGHKRIQDICKVMTECGANAVVTSKRMLTCINGAVLGEQLAYYTCGVQSESLMTEDYKLGTTAKVTGKKPPWCASPMGYPEGEWPDNAVGLGKGKKG
jgi:methylglutaconyl-CoA hydratase